MSNHNKKNNNNGGGNVWNNNNNNNNGGGNNSRRRKNSHNNNSNCSDNGGSHNGSKHNSNQPNAFHFNRDTFPPNVHSDDFKYYCCLHGNDCNHNGGTCKRMVQGHLPNATTYICTNGNSASINHIMFPSQVGLIGRLEAEAMAACGNNGCVGNQALRMPTWNQQANMGMGMGRAPSMTIPR